MWKKPILQKTDFEAAKFITMTNEEMEETRGQCHLVKALALIFKRAEYVEIHILLFFNAKIFEILIKRLDK